MVTISNQYDPKISALQNEVSAFKAEGAYDSTQDIQKGKDQLDQQLTAVQKLKNEAEYQNHDMEIDYELAQKVYNENYNLFFETTEPRLEKLLSDFQKEQQDLNQISSLQSQKGIAIDLENHQHVINLENISV